MSWEYYSKVYNVFKLHVIPFKCLRQSQNSFSVQWCWCLLPVKKEKKKNVAVLGVYQKTAAAGNDADALGHESAPSARLHVNNHWISWLPISFTEVSPCDKNLVLMGVGNWHGLFSANLSFISSQEKNNRSVLASSLHASSCIMLLYERVNCLIYTFPISYFSLLNMINYHVIWNVPRTSARSTLHSFTKKEI